ncbi:hypothetical protein HID58_086640, partial [Brassica napus]
MEKERGREYIIKLRGELEPLTSDLLGLLENSYWQIVCPDLYQFLGLDRRCFLLLYSLPLLLVIVSRQLTKYTLLFHPVSAIINDSLRITKESAENADFTGCCHRQTDRQIRYLRAGIRCVILSQTRIRVFHIGDLEERIKSLLNLRRNVSDTAEPPRAATSHVWNLQRKLFPPLRANLVPEDNNAVRAPYMLLHTQPITFLNMTFSLNQRLTWPIDHYSRGFNSDYNYNQWTQPEGPL